MKKAAAGLLASLLVLTALPAVAAAAEPRPVDSTTKAEALCTQLFSAERCESLAGAWARMLSTPSDENVREVTDRLLSELNRSRSSTGVIPCEAIFSEQVCNAIGLVWGTIDDIVSDPGGKVDEIRTIIVGIIDRLVDDLQCMLDPTTCWLAGRTVPSGATADAVVCREVFSDAVCDTIEDPGPLVAYLIGYVWNAVRCYIDPACSPIDRTLCEIVNPCPGRLE